MGLKRNIISNFILTASTIVLPLITFPYVTRTLSSKAIGDVFFIDAFTQYFILFASLGIPFYGIREIAKNRKDHFMVSTLVVELVILQICLSCFSIIIFFSLGYLFRELAPLMELIAIGALMIMSTSFTIEWFFQGIESFTYITKRSLFFKIISVFAIIFFVKQGSDSKIYYLILALVVTANAVLNFVFFIKNHYKEYSFSSSIFRHFKPLLILFSINASVSVYVILDSIILGFLTDTVNVSYYNIPLKLVKIFWLIISGIGTVFIPRISAFHANEDTLAIQNLMTKSISIVLLLSLPFCFLCLVYPAEILILISGKKYLPATSALQLLSFIPLIIGLCNVFGTQFLLPIGKEKNILYAAILGLIISLCFNFSLIPKFKFLGSAIAAIAAESCVCLYVFLATRKYIKVIFDYLLLLQICFSLIITFIFYFLTREYIVGLYSIACSATIYIVSLLISQIYLKNKFLASLLQYGKNTNLTH